MPTIGTSTPLNSGCNIDSMFGQYRVLWSPPGYSNQLIDLGVTEGQFILTYGSESIPITNTNRFGNSEVDGIYLGGNYAIAIVFKEWNIDVAATVWPYGVANGRNALPTPRDGIAGMGASGAIGQSECSMAGELLLDPLTGPASLQSPNTRSTFYAPRANFMPNHSIDTVIGLGERVFAHVFKLWPVETEIAGTVPKVYESRWFTWQTNTNE